MQAPSTGGMSFAKK